MQLKRALLLAAATLFGAILESVLFVRACGEFMVRRAPHFSESAQTNVRGGTMKINPNKMLFISCGGFVE
jgi:hypothetical protein